MPMEEGAKFVAVVGLFRHPDMVNNTGNRCSDMKIRSDKTSILEAGITI